MRIPGQDLADRLDRLEVGDDRQLQPRPLGGLPVRLSPPRRPRSTEGVADPTQDPAAAVRVHLLAELAGQLLEQLALAPVELGGDRDVDQHVEVAADRRAARLRHAPAAEPDLGARLRPGPDLDLPPRPSATWES